MAGTKTKTRAKKAVKGKSAAKKPVKGKPAAKKPAAKKPADELRDLAAQLQAATRELAYERRLDHYVRAWGKKVKTIDVDLGQGRSMKIHDFTAQDDDGDPFHVLRTNGLSDAPIDDRLFELTWYVNKVTPAQIAWLTFMAIVAITDEVDLFERTLPMAIAPSEQPPLAKGSVLTSVTFRPSIFSRDSDHILCPGLGEIETYWAIPISEAERAHLNQHKKRFGAALSSMLQDHKHPWLLAEGRASYV